MGPAARFWRHTGVLTAIGVLLAVGLAAAFMSIGHSPQPRDVPVAVVGPPAAAKQLEATTKGALDARAVADSAAARQAIGQRDVYAAVLPQNEVLISSAASNQTANFMRRALGQSADGQPAPRVVDAKPLPKDDANGLSIGLLVQVLMVAGSLGVVGLTKALPRLRANPRQGVLPLAFLAGYGLLLGLAVAGLAAAFGVGAGASFIDTALALALIGTAVTASTGAVVALIGPAGAGLTSLVYFVLGAQISGAGTAPEFLPPFWSDLGQALPAGAGTSLLRDVFYFPEASTSGPVAILAAYVGVGFLAVMALSLLHLRRERSEPRGAVAPAAA